MNHLQVKKAVYGMSHTSGWMGGLQGRAALMPWVYRHCDGGRGVHTDKGCPHKQQVWWPN
eukprot:285296-Chlamydomonas_euryale.AAC.1